MNSQKIPATKERPHPLAVIGVISLTIQWVVFIVWIVADDQIGDRHEINFRYVYVIAVIITLACGIALLKNRRKAGLILLGFWLLWFFIACLFPQL